MSKRKRADTTRTGSTAATSSSSPSRPSASSLPSRSSVVTAGKDDAGAAYGIVVSASMNSENLVQKVTKNHQVMSITQL